MNSKTKIITTAAATFGLAVGAAGLLGYRNIDDQWQQFEQKKILVEQTQGKSQLEIETQHESLNKREIQDIWCL